MSAGAEPRTLLDYLRLAADYLKKRGSSSPRLDAELLLAHVLGLDRVGLYVNFDRPLTRAEVDAFRDALRRRGQGEPVAYIVGEKPFLTTSLLVTPAVLIPRPETELLVEAAVGWLRGQPGPQLWVADVGTGSGAIAVGVALGEPRARVVAVDISPEAADVARRNVARHGLEDRVQVLVGDLLSPWFSGLPGGPGRLDAVVSNPPYVATDELAALPRDVRDFEPRLALDGGPDGLAVYRRLIPMATAALRPGGLLALEIGAAQGTAVAGMLAASGAWTGVRVEKDYGGHDRVVLALRREEDAA